MIHCIEGINYSGKSTLARALSARLDNCPIIEFPRRDIPPVGPLIRDYLNKELFVEEAYDGAGATIHQCLQLADKMDAAGAIQTARDTKRNLVLVRYWPSAVVYGQLDGLDRNWLERTTRCLPEADVYTLLDIDPDEAVARKAKRDAHAPVYEQVAQMRECARLYRELWDSAPYFRTGVWEHLMGVRPVQMMVDALT